MTFKKGYVPWNKGLTKETHPSIKNMSENMKGKRSPRWKGGKRINAFGYWTVYKPNHPRATSEGYVREHILIAEKMLGRSLKYFGSHHKDNEMPHHINFIKSDNREENLFICNRSKHGKIHIKYGTETETLYKLGLLKFNKENGEYYLDKNSFNKPITHNIIPDARAIVPHDGI